MMILFHFNICMLSIMYSYKIRQKKRYDSKEEAHKKRRRDEWLQQTGYQSEKGAAIYMCTCGVVGG